MSETNKNFDPKVIADFGNEWSEFQYNKGEAEEALIDQFGTTLEKRFSKF